MHTPDRWRRDSTPTTASTEIHGSGYSQYVTSPISLAFECHKSTPANREGDGNWLAGHAGRPMEGCPDDMAGAASPHIASKLSIRVENPCRSLQRRLKRLRGGQVESLRWLIGEPIS